MTCYVGLMSGTSLDGVDGVVAVEDTSTGRLVCAAHAHLPFAAELRAELLALNQRGDDELHRAALAANAVVGVYAELVNRLLPLSQRQRHEVTAIGAHGQTVRHRPGEFDGTGYTVQLMNGALLAERTGIDVVCDFRSRDVAAGGQGAPLVPAFHAATFGQRGEHRAVLNLGGIANLTLLAADGAVSGFDTGPANLLLDAWCQEHRGLAFDENGAWAGSGRVDTALLQRWLAHPYFSRRPPKSTGRDLFDLSWLRRGLPETVLDPADVMATLAELTVSSVCDALLRHAPATSTLVVCGGGAHNGHLMQQLSTRLPGIRVVTSTAMGVAPEHVEALAFAWLAQAFTQRRTGSLPAVTGAQGARVLGACYPAA